MVGEAVDAMSRFLWRHIAIVAIVFVIGLGALADDCTSTVQPGESIQEAIDAAPVGAVICLAEGEWEEHLEISKPLILRGAEGEAIIRGHEENTPVVLVSTLVETDVVAFFAALTLAGGRGIGASGLVIEGLVQATATDVTFAVNDCEPFGGLAHHGGPPEDGDGHPPADRRFRNLRRACWREGFFSLSKALASIWRTRSRLTPNKAPTSFRVRGWPSRRP